MALSLYERELLMMLWRDAHDKRPRMSGIHMAEYALTLRGFAEKRENQVYITEKGAAFWKSFLEARGDSLKVKRDGYHDGYVESEDDDEGDYIPERKRRRW